MTSRRRTVTVPDRMRAAVTTAHGGPEVVEVTDDWPVPAPGPGRALVRVAAAAVNNTDLWSRAGSYGTGDDPDAVAGWRGVPLEFPLIQGGDIAGTVVAVGSDRDASLVGRRVVVDPIIEYDEGRPVAVVGSEADGGFAEYHESDVAQLHDVTDSPLDDGELACLPIAYGTAMGMVERGGILPGERVLVTGASGGVGSAAVQILVARDCEVVAQTSPAHADVVSGWGTSEVVVRGRDDIGSIEPVDAVLDVVGGDGFGRVLDRLRPAGRLVTVGAVAGPVVTVDLRRLYLPQRRIQGSTMHTPEQFSALMDLARAGSLSPVVTATYPLEQIGVAQERFGEGGFVGKLVLVP